MIIHKRYTRESLSTFVERMGWEIRIEEVNTVFGWKYVATVCKNYPKDLKFKLSSVPQGTGVSETAALEDLAGVISGTTLVWDCLLNYDVPEIVHR